MLARMNNCPLCGGRVMEQRKGLWHSTAFCSWCAVRMRREMPWLSHSVGGITAFMTAAILQGIDPFDRATSWLQRGLGAVVLAAAIALFWLGAGLLNAWQPLRSSTAAVPRRKRVLAVLLVSAAVLSGVGGLLFSTYNDGQTLPFSSPSVFRDPLADTIRNRALRGRLVTEGKGPGFVRGMVVDAAVPEGSATMVVHPDGTVITMDSTQSTWVVREQSEDSLAAGRQLCTEASRLGQHFRGFKGTLRPGFPYPAPGQVRFYVNTDDDLLVAEASLAELASPAHPLSSLWKAAEHARRVR